MATNENKVIESNEDQDYHHREEKLHDLALKLMHKKLDDDNDNCMKIQTPMKAKSQRKQEMIITVQMI